MGWSGLVLCTDADLGALEPEATNGHWKSVTWPNQRAEAKRDLKIWLEIDYAHIDGVADKIKDTYRCDVVAGYTSGVYSDLTDAASDDTEDDVDLSDVFVSAANDRLYVGFAGESSALAIKMLASLNAVASVLTVKYSGPSGWTALTVVDGTIATSGKTLGQSGRITWTVPTNWQRRTLTDDNAYFWLELKVSAALTSGTSLSQLLAVRAPDGLKRVCAFRALGYIYKNLAAQAPSTDYWSGRVSNQFKTGYWDLADALYAAMRDKGGIPIDVDNNDVIEPEESNITAPIRIGRA
jgi:hypothetical protein